MDFKKETWAADVAEVKAPFRCDSFQSGKLVAGSPVGTGCGGDPTNRTRAPSSASCLMAAGVLALTQLQGGITKAR